MTDGPGSMPALRAAAARIEALDDAHAGDPAEGDPTGHADPTGHFDPAEHAERFAAVHDALVAVLAEIENITDPGSADRDGVDRDSTDRAGDRT